MIQIYREHKDAVFPTRAHINDAGLDIYSVERSVLIPGERVLVHTGLRVVVPGDSYYTFAPRSSLAFKHNVIPSHHNVMDSGYRGNCSVLMYNRGSHTYEIAKGDRFCQLIVYKVPYKTVREIGEDDFRRAHSTRKDAGFGSSGR